MHNKFRIKKIQRLLFTILIAINFLHNLHAENKQTLTMGWEEWAPFTFTNKQGQVIGLDAELIQSVIPRMGHELEYIELPWKRTLSLLERGETHIAASAFKTSEREAYAHFSIPYQKETYMMYVRKGEAKQYKQRSLQDIKDSNFRFGVLRGSVYGHTFNELMKEASFAKQVEAVAKDEQNHLKLLSGRFDGFIQETSRLAANKENAELLSKIEPLFIVDQNMLHIMFSKKSVSTDFVEQFNKQLQSYMNDGAYENLFAKYGLHKSNMITADAELDSAKSAGD